MKTITPEIKARIFANYWNQLVWKSSEYGLLLKVSAYNFDLAEKNGISLNDSYLELKQIKDITREDVKEVNDLFKFISPITNLELEPKRLILQFESKQHKVIVSYSDDTRLVIFGDGSRIDKKETDFGENILTQTNYLKFYHLLQSKGYALPYMDYSVEDLVELGVYKLKQ